MKIGNLQNFKMRKSEEKFKQKKELQYIILKIDDFFRFDYIEVFEL